MRRLVCAFVVRRPPKTGFLAARLINIVFWVMLHTKWVMLHTKYQSFRSSGLRLDDFDFEPVVQEISYFLSRALLTPFLAEQNHLCNFGRGHHEEHLCEIILNLDQWFRRRCHLKTFHI